MKRILKKDYVEFMTKCEKLIIDNLDVVSVEDWEMSKRFICQSDTVGNYYISLDKYDSKYNNKVYYIVARFEDLEKTRETFGDGYFNANIGYTGKMTFSSFGNEDEKEMMYNRFYDLVCALLDENTEIKE